MADLVQVNFPEATHEIRDLSGIALNQVDSLDVVLHGYLGRRSDLSKTLSFTPLLSRSLDSIIQIVSKHDSSHGANSPHHSLRSITPQSPVVVTGRLKAKKRNSEPRDQIPKIQHVELELSHIQCLNKFPNDLIGAIDNVFGPEDRHLQLRTNKDLRDALHFRAKLAKLCRSELEGNDFVEIETPLLFKSTPEGAREFVVPSRQRGLAYALPQSPQQFKQILMGSGISRYYQLARCFRDEDLRADRQPEFTQLDLEMSFATGADVMRHVTRLIKTLWKFELKTELPDEFQSMTYEHAMSSYGSDKPDLRISSPITRVEHLFREDLQKKLTSLHNPIIEVFSLNLSPPPNSDDTPSNVARSFINEFLDSPSAAPFNSNPYGSPGIFIYDPLAPLRGLSAIGFEAVPAIEELLGPDEGTLIVLQARPRKLVPYGSTALGNLRSLLLKNAFKQKVLEPEVSYAPLWITEFPLFTPTKNNPGEGQRSPMGLSSTHHPFTSPLNSDHVSELSQNPEKVLADHYDLVINGVELGGGSRRIHNADFQEYILRDVLKLPDERMKEFEHLIKVLKAGCPPHAGFALGFDRLVALMLGKESVRDVMAFPKGNGGEDKCVGSPAALRKGELERYGLEFKKRKPSGVVRFVNPANR
ncbi:MAG: hypothetical protein Q9191_003296 [Dirinaria sp. TL-2023a]